jgi:Domain of unknown function (DUF6538)
MAKLLRSSGPLIVKVKHLYARKDGALFYVRRVPRDLKEAYGNQTFIRKYLRTKDLREASKLIVTLASRDEALWRSTN